MAGDHRCPVCDATFTRPQHVARHMRSHTGDRPYKCLYCTDQFARSDLLNRHVNKCHDAEKRPAADASGGAPGRKTTKTALRATTSKQTCDQCVKANSPCDGAKPCSRCLQRKVRCTFVEFGRQTAPSGPGHPTDDTSISDNSRNTSPTDLYSSMFQSQPHHNHRSFYSRDRYQLAQEPPTLVPDIDYGRESASYEVSSENLPVFGGASFDASQQWVGQDIQVPQQQQQPQFAQTSPPPPSSTYWDVNLVGNYGDRQPTNYRSDDDLHEFTSSISSRRLRKARSTFEFRGNSGGGPGDDSIPSSASSSSFNIPSPFQTQTFGQANSTTSFDQTYPPNQQHQHHSASPAPAPQPSSQHLLDDSDPTQTLAPSFHSAFGVLSIHEPDAAPFFSHLVPPPQPSQQQQQQPQSQPSQPQPTSANIQPFRPPTTTLNNLNRPNSATAVLGGGGGGQLLAGPGIQMGFSSEHPDSMVVTPMSRDDLSQWMQFSGGSINATPTPGPGVSMGSGIGVGAGGMNGTPRRRAASMYTGKTPTYSLIDGSDTFLLQRGVGGTGEYGLGGVSHAPLPPAASSMDMDLRQGAQIQPQGGIQNAQGTTYAPPSATTAGENLSGWSAKIQSQRLPELRLEKAKAKARRQTVAGGETCERGGGDRESGEKDRGRGQGKTMYEQQRRQLEEHARLGHSGGVSSIPGAPSSGVHRHPLHQISTLLPHHQRLDRQEQLRHHSSSPIDPHSRSSSSTSNRSWGTSGSTGNEQSERPSFKRLPSSTPLELDSLRGGKARRVSSCGNGTGADAGPVSAGPGGTGGGTGAGRVGAGGGGGGGGADAGRRIINLAERRRRASADAGTGTGAEMTPFSLGLSGSSAFGV